MEANRPIYKTRIGASQLIASAFFLTPLILGQAIAFFIDETFFWSAGLLTLTCGVGLDLCVVCGNAYTEHRQHTDIHRSPKTLPTGNFGEMFQALGLGLLLPRIGYLAQAATGVLCRRLCSYPIYCCNSPPPLPSRPASAHNQLVWFRSLRALL